MAPLMNLLPELLNGLKITLLLTFGAVGVALLASFTAGLGRLSHNPLFKGLATVYVEVFRGTSALVQLFWVYFALPLVGIKVDAMTAGILVLGLNTGSYGAEVVRGAILAVPKGQYEAAYALSFSDRMILWRIIMPQAIIAMLPPFGNLAIELLKNTALVSMITLGDLTFKAQTLRAATLQSAQIFIWVLLIYFLVAQAINFSIRALERKLTLGRNLGGAH
ncbi:MAG: ectoine/hydroxyectoine ABC transporter permease subunit EhuC [Nitrospinaceae bacterium]|nr:ectoine/hydroxyectoine ABC transporter permease subunit EhuC [Nitrospinaceae bacterium]NIR56156.1 ectoine/hydroxyectoine ABC transporter permease subunit EhuC [Nitrospinaceae bacterium]NIS86612.1 ectoine/hydroxyectoine ABC transporter permease subunit EhuC [Nitrospinaceae bacterium]NIT83442.1 ectoine/hydroxyectoine ABC transporter permease subunit EhuC [Nitrospinaceae bacterium]NIU45650.1 ectoine/hydroxyectoine ABC transporter permease subunit EhuC [Nitrospinaceae bacterium]